MTIRIVIAPAKLGTNLNARPKHEVRHNDHLLGRFAVPFFDSARALVAKGLNPALTLEAEWTAKPGAVAMRMNLGTAAGLTVEEDARRGLRQRPHRTWPQGVRDAPQTPEGEPSAASAVCAAPLAA